MENVRNDAFLRLCAILLVVLAACLVGFDKQTKVLFYTVRKASFRDLNSFVVLVWIYSAAAGYNALQVLRYFLYSSQKEDFGRSYRRVAWATYLLDQAVVYIVFAANSAAFEPSFIAVTGESSFQWMKLCNSFTKFCIQIGGALLCGIVASFLLAAISFLSAYRILRLYSPKRFLQLKDK